MVRHRVRLAVVLIFLALTSLACTLSSLRGPSIVGTWQGTYDGDRIEMVFERDGHFVINVAGSTETGQYRVDMSTMPVQLDLITDAGTILTIIEFVDNNTLRLENNYNDEPRPTAFSDTATFHRVNP
ncbi:MAG: hypothetical protein JXB85_11395 [Anaerolineales bacterium]|nr:hypothetical protein [Anaerolineales bacterium]